MLIRQPKKRLPLSFVWRCGHLVDRYVRDDERQPSTLHGRPTRWLAVGTELRSEMQTGFATLRADFIEGTNRQIKWMVTFAAGWTTLLVTLVRFVP